MVKYFYDTPATIYRTTQSQVRWSLVENKTLLYKTKVSFWKSKERYGNTNLAVQTDLNWYEINLLPTNPIIQGDIVVIRDETYKVDNVIEHNNIRWKLDNIQAYISKTTE